MSRRAWLWILPLLLVATAGCGAAAPAAGVPSGASAPEHREAARAHEREAARHRALYDPSASASRSRPFVFPVVRNINAEPDRLGAVESGYGTGDYNPTEPHLEEASAHLRHARQHLAAARRLELSTEKACRSIPPRVRSECPLLRSVSRVELVPGGVRLHLARGARASAVLEHMRCHHAFGRETGFDEMPACPLYLPDLTMRLDRAGTAIDLIGASDETALEIRRRSESISKPEKPEPAGDE